MNSLRGWRLQILNCEGANAEVFTTKTKSITIGSSLSCNVRYFDPRVLKIHCKIYINDVGKIQIVNYAKNDSVCVDDKSVLKRSILDPNSIVSLFDKKFRWEYITESKKSINKRSSIKQAVKRKSLIYTSFIAGNKKFLSKTPTICSLARKTKKKKIAKRITIHNFEHNISILNKTSGTECFSTPKSTMDYKENQTPSSAHPGLSNSGVLILSYPSTPVGRAAQNTTHYQTPKSNLKPNILKMSTPKSVYKTPKGVLSEINESLDNIQTPMNTKSMYLIDLVTPQTVKQNKSSVKSAKNTTVSHKSLIDLTTPEIPKTPTSKPVNKLLRSAIKNASVKTQTPNATAQQKSASVSKRTTPLKILKCTPDVIVIKESGSNNPASPILKKGNTPNKKLENAKISNKVENSPRKQAADQFQRTPRRSLRYDTVKDIKDSKIVETPKKSTDIKFLNNTLIGGRRSARTPKLPKTDLTDEADVKNILLTPTTKHNGDCNDNGELSTHIVSKIIVDDKSIVSIDKDSIPVADEVQNLGDSCSSNSGTTTQDPSEKVVASASNQIKYEQDLFTQDAFDRLTGKPIVKHTYSRNIKSLSPNTKFNSSVAYSTDFPQTDIVAWIESVETPVLKPNCTRQILSSRYSNVTPHESFLDQKLGDETSELASGSDKNPVRPVYSNSKVAQVREEGLAFASPQNSTSKRLSALTLSPVTSISIIEYDKSIMEENQNTNPELTPHGSDDKCLADSSMQCEENIVSSDVIETMAVDKADTDNTLPETDRIISQDDGDEVNVSTITCALSEEPTTSSNITSSEIIDPNKEIEIMTDDNTEIVSVTISSTNSETEILLADSKNNSLIINSDTKTDVSVTDDVNSADSAIACTSSEAIAKTETVCDEQNLENSINRAESIVLANPDVLENVSTDDVIETINNIDVIQENTSTAEINNSILDINSESLSSDLNIIETMMVNPIDEKVEEEITSCDAVESDNKEDASKTFEVSTSNNVIEDSQSEDTLPQDNSEMPTSSSAETEEVSINLPTTSSTAIDADVTTGEIIDSSFEDGAANLSSSNKTYTENVTFAADSLNKNNDTMAVNNNDSESSIVLLDSDDESPCTSSTAAPKPVISPSKLCDSYDNDVNLCISDESLVDSTKDDSIVKLNNTNGNNENAVNENSFTADVEISDKATEEAVANTNDLDEISSGIPVDEITNKESVVESNSECADLTFDENDLEREVKEMDQPYLSNENSIIISEETKTMESERSDDIVNILSESLEEINSSEVSDANIFVTTPSKENDSLLNAAEENDSLTSPSAKQSNYLSSVAEKQEVLKTPKSGPKNDLTDVYGVKNLMKTPGNIPRNDLTIVVGVKELLKTPSVGPKNDLSDVRGIKNLMKTPTNNSRNDLTNIVGVKELLKTPNPGPKNDLTDVRGIKNLMKTPGNVPTNDLSNVVGVKELLQTPNPGPKNDLTDVRGIKNLMKTPGNIPTNDLSNVVGVKELLQTPNPGPKNDLSDVRGIKLLLQTPKNKPQNDLLSNVVGVKELLQTPNPGPKNDLSDVYGVRGLMKTPGNIPTNDLSNVVGVKELLKTPSVRPKNDLSDVRGVKHLLKTPSNKLQNDLLNISGVKEMLETPRIKDLAKTSLPIKIIEEEPSTSISVTASDEDKPAEENINSTKAQILEEQNVTVLEEVVKEINTNTAQVDEQSENQEIFPIQNCNATFDEKVASVETTEDNVSGVTEIVGYDSRNELNNEKKSTFASDVKELITIEKSNNIAETEASETKLKIRETEELEVQNQNLVVDPNIKIKEEQDIEVDGIESSEKMTSTKSFSNKRMRLDNVDENKLTKNIETRTDVAHGIGDVVINVQSMKLEIIDDVPAIIDYEENQDIVAERTVAINDETFTTSKNDQTPIKAAVTTKRTRKASQTSQAEGTKIERVDPTAVDVEIVQQDVQKEKVNEVQTPVRPRRRKLTVDTDKTEIEAKPAVTSNTRGRRRKVLVDLVEEPKEALDDNSYLNKETPVEPVVIPNTETTAAQQTKKIKSSAVKVTVKPVVVVDDQTKSPPNAVEVAVKIATPSIGTPMRSKRLENRKINLDLKNTAEENAKVPELRVRQKRNSGKEQPNKDAKQESTVATQSDADVLIDVNVKPKRQPKSELDTLSVPAEIVTSTPVVKRRGNKKVNATTTSSIPVDAEPEPVTPKVEDRDDVPNELTEETVVEKPKRGRKVTSASKPTDDKSKRQTKRSAKAVEVELNSEESEQIDPSTSTAETRPKRQIRVTSKAAEIIERAIEKSPVVENTPSAAASSKKPKRVTKKSTEASAIAETNVETEEPVAVEEKTTSARAKRQAKSATSSAKVLPIEATDNKTPVINTPAAKPRGRPARNVKTAEPKESTPTPDVRDDRATPSVEKPQRQTKKPLKLMDEVEPVATPKAKRGAKKAAEVEAEIVDSAGPSKRKKASANPKVEVVEKVPEIEDVVEAPKNRKRGKNSKETPVPSTNPPMKKKKDDSDEKPQEEAMIGKRTLRSRK